MTNEEPLMNDEQTAESIAKVFEENPALLDGIVPQHDMWAAIESRISTRVLPLSASQTNKRRTTTWRWIPVLLAASALIAATAGITYIATSRAIVQRGSASVATNTRNPANAQSTGVASGLTESGISQGPAQVTQLGSTQATQGDVERTRVAESTQPKRSGVQLASQTGVVATDQVRKTYDSEIELLHAALEARRSQLNPSTVQIIEQNLDVIDEAIRQSRAALAKDPASRLLNEQLDRTLAKKTGLLRAAVLLPAA